MIPKQFYSKFYIDILLILILIGFFTFWFFDDLNIQGLYCDVALVGNAALGSFKNLNYNLNSHRAILGGRIPLMVNDYNAATDIYAAVPWVYFLGNNPLALNIPGFIWGSLSIAALYMTLMQLYNSKLYTLMVSSMLVSSPAFIVSARLGSFTGVLTIFFVLIAVFSLLQWRKRGLTLWLFIMGLSMGIGIAGKIQILWFINAMLIYSIFTGSLGKGRMFLKHIAILFMGMVFGAFSLILANIKEGFFTLKFLARYSITSRSGIPNMHYLNNLMERLRESLSLIDGSALSQIDTPNRIGIYLFFLGMTFILLRFTYRYIKKYKVKEDMVLLPLAFFILIIIQSPFTPTILHVHHIILLLPFMYMIACMPCYSIAATVNNAKQSGSGYLFLIKKNLKIALYIIVILMGGIFIFNNYYLLKYKQAHRNIHGGQEVKWDVMSEVKDFFMQSGIYKVGLGDTSFKDPLLFLSNFDLELEEIFPAHHKGITEKEAERNLIERFNRESEGYYLFRTEENALIHFFNRFANIAEQNGKKVELLREFKSPEGIPVFRVYKVH